MRRVLFALALTVIAIAQTQTVNAQGLAERRAIKEYEEKKFPEFKKQITEAAGFDVKVTVNWDKLAVAGKADKYMDDAYMSDIFFNPLIEALKEVGQDEMGKTALKEKLKEIVITYDPSTAPASNYKNGYPFNNGVLTINNEPWSNSDPKGGPNFTDRVAAIKGNLEEKM